MNELQELYEYAQLLQSRQVPAHEINQRIRKATNGEVPGLASLELKLGQTGATGVTRRDERLAAAAQAETNPADAFLRNAMDAITFGGADELGGAIAGAGALIPGGRSPGEAYAQQANDMRNELLAGQMNHPVASALGLGAGAVLTGRAGAKLAPGMLGGARGANQGASIGRLAGRAAGAGAAGGAAYGALGTEGGVAERGMGALGGGAIGGAAGGLLGGAAAGGGALLDNISGGFQPQSQRIVRNLLRRGTEMTGRSADDLVAAQRELGDIAALVDVDPVFAAQAGAAQEVSPALTRTGGPVDALGQRHATTGHRVLQAMRKLTNVADDPTLGTERTRHQALRAVADRVYGPIQDSNVQVGGSQLDDVIGAWPELQEIVKKIKPNWEAGQNLTAREVQQLVQMTREMQSELIRRPAAGQRYVEAADALTDAVDEVLPALRPANRAYARESARLGAYETGIQAGANRPRVMRDAFESLRGDPEAEQAFRRGVLDYWEDRLVRSSGVRGGTGELIRASQVPGQDELRGRLRLLFDSDEAFDSFVDELARSDIFAQTYNRIARNSLTAARQSAKEAFFPPEPSITSRVTRPMRRLLAMIPDEITRRAAAEELGRILMTQGDEAAEDYLQAVLRGRTVANLGQRIAATPSRAMGGILGAQAAREGMSRGMDQDATLLNF